MLVFAILCTLLRPATAACLAPDALDALGFTVGNVTAPVVSSNSTLCRSLASSVGLCVDSILLEAKLYTDMRTFTERYNVVQRLGEALDLLVANTTENVLVSNSTELASLNSVISDLKAQIGLNAIKCHAAVVNAQMGANCLLASASASNTTQLVSGGVNLLVQSDLATQVEAQCLAVFDALCLLSAGQTISANATLPATYTFANPRVVAACKSLVNYEACNQDDCAVDRRNKLLEYMVRLFDYTLYPSTLFFDNLQSHLQQAAQPSAPLQTGSPSWEVTLVVDSQGENLSSVGAGSGIEPLQPFTISGAALLLPTLLLLFSLLG